MQKSPPFPECLLKFIPKIPPPKIDNYVKP